MTSLLPLCLILACRVLFGSCADSACANSCCANESSPASCQACVVPGNCRNPRLQLVDFDPTVTSPLYEHVLILNDRSRIIDNCCTTYFRITASVLLYFRSCVLTNGTGYIDFYISGPTRGCTGVHRAQGVKSFNIIEGCKSCVMNAYLLGEACLNTYVSYRCYHTGDCDGLDANEELRTGLSTYRDLSECCKDRIIALANEQSDVFYLTRNFIKLPGLLNRKCVMSFNGASCIGSDTIRPGDAISLPQHDSCAQGSRSDL